MVDIGIRPPQRRPHRKAPFAAPAITGATPPTPSPLAAAGTVWHDMHYPKRHATRKICTARSHRSSARLAQLYPRLEEAWCKVVHLSEPHQNPVPPRWCGAPGTLILTTLIAKRSVCDTRHAVPYLNPRSLARVNLTRAEKKKNVEAPLAGRCEGGTQVSAARLD